MMNLYTQDNNKQINKEDLNLNNLLDAGAEGFVYDISDDEVAKLLYNPTRSKMAKINELSKLKIKNFIFPNNIIVNNNNEKIGYTMKKIDTYKYENLDNKLLKCKTVTDKINYLKKLENNLKIAHKNNLVVVDFNLQNFLSDDNNITMLDTDNYTYKCFMTDIYPRYYYYYVEKTKGGLTPDLDKFMFTMKLLEKLVKGSFGNLELTKYCDNEINDYIENLNISKYMKEFLLMQVSDSKEKEYFGNKLDELSTSDEFIYTK